MLHGDTAAKCTIMFKNYALTSTRLTFGGFPCPTQFCTASELCTDLTNDLLHCRESTIFSPHADQVGKTVYLSSSIPFKGAKELDVVIPENDLGQIDDFIDYGITIVPDLGKNSKCTIQALLLAVHILFRPTDPKEPVLRDDFLSLGKLLEEGFLTETPVILGWQINTRTPTIQLPNEKFKCWSQELSETILTKMIS
jgi:hypothetical protein